WAVIACGFWVTTERTSTAESGSTLIKASPATVTFVVRFDFFVHPVTRNIETHMLIKNTKPALDEVKIGTAIACVPPESQIVFVSLDVGNRHWFRSFR